MNIFSDSTLPCLQAVAPWWTEVDRRQLFGLLLMIFPFDAGYLASLPASRYMDGSDQYALDAQEIRKSFHVLKDMNGSKKCSCARIRSQEFSFGKLNPRFCYLCPYSGTYRNHSKADERRFLYHILCSRTRSLSDYIDAAGKRPSDIFISYFPAYIDDLLVDAYPFSLIAEKFTERPSNAFLDEPGEFCLDSITASIHSDIRNRLGYLRIKDLVCASFPDYQETMLLSADRELSELKRENADTRPINETLMKRLFLLLSRDRKPYVRKKPEDYVSPERAQTVSQLLSGPLFKMAAGTDRQAPTPEPEILPESPLIQPDFIPDTLCSRGNSLPPAFTASVSGPSCSRVSEAKIPGNALPPSFPAFYVCEAEAGVVPYGLNGPQKDQALLCAFLSGSTGLSMEPVIFKETHGILMMNDSEDFLFYPIGQYGPKPVRAIADAGTAVYTSNIHALCQYLYRNKVFLLSPRDVGIAVSLQGNRSISGPAELFGDKASFPGCMAIYRQLYLDSVSQLSAETAATLSRLETFFPLLCTDGNPPPFSDMESLCSISESAIYKYSHDSQKSPLCPGVFLFQKAYLDGISIAPESLISSYMDTCIDLNRRLPFTNGNIFILKLDQNGILLYVTGNKMDIRKVRLYLSSSARRAFASIAGRGNPVTFEEMAQEYTPPKIKPQTT